MEAVEAVLRYVTAGLVMEGCLTGTYAHVFNISESVRKEVWLHMYPLLRNS